MICSTRTVVYVIIRHLDCSLPCRLSTGRRRTSAQKSVRRCYIEPRLCHHDDELLRKRRPADQHNRTLQSHLSVLSYFHQSSVIITATLINRSASKETCEMNDPLVHGVCLCLCCSHLSCTRYRVVFTTRIRTGLRVINCLEPTVSSTLKSEVAKQKSQPTSYGVRTRLSAKVFQPRNPFSVRRLRSVADFRQASANTLTTAWNGVYLSGVLRVD